MSEQLVTAAYNAGMVDGADAERARIVRLLRESQDIYGWVQWDVDELIDAIQPISRPM